MRRDRGELPLDGGTAGPGPRRAAGVPWVVRVAAGIGLIVALPALLVIALLVRGGSHGPVLVRSPGVDRLGRPCDLLAFRTVVDGAQTTTHRRMRSTVGDAGPPLTGPGRLLRASRLELLPRLLNLAAGHGRP